MNLIKNSTRKGLYIDDEHYLEKLDEAFIQNMNCINFLKMFCDIAKAFLFMHNYGFSMKERYSVFDIYYVR